MIHREQALGRRLLGPRGLGVSAALGLATSVGVAWAVSAWGRLSPAGEAPYQSVRVRTSDEAGERDEHWIVRWSGDFGLRRVDISGPWENRLGRAVSVA